MADTYQPAARSDAEVIADLTAASQAAIRAGVDAAPFVIVPDKYRVQDIERTLREPTRQRGTVTLHDLDSFIAFVAIATEGALFWSANEVSAKFEAVFNPQSWRDHRAVYSPAYSPEWTRWMQANGGQKDQAAFAAFVENNAVDIVSPQSADMVEISRSLEAKKKVNFASGIRLSNGQTELTYEEEIQGTAAKGKLQIPETFRLGIPVFVAGQKYAVDARLRYRIDSGHLRMWYELVRPHIVLQDAVTTIVESIKAKIKLPIYRGELPPA